MGIPVVEGRAFTSADEATPAVMINETMARTFYRGQSPIGRRVKPSGPATIPCSPLSASSRRQRQGGVEKKTGTELYFNLMSRPGVNSWADELRAADVDDAKRRLPGRSNGR